MFRIVLDFKDRNMANAMWRKLQKDQIGFSMKSEIIEEEKYPIAFVQFQSGKPYTYRLSEKLYDDMRKGEKSRKRNWPTQYGLSYGEAVDLEIMTMSEINKIYPFEKISIVEK